MRYFTLFLFALCTCALAPNEAAAQLELGVKAGTSIYSGDLSPNTFGLDLDDAEFAGGLYLRYRPIPRAGVRINGNFGRLSAERTVNIRNELNQQTAVTRSFRSSISEFNIVGEFDLFYLGDPEDNFFAPYVYGGIGVLSYNPQAPDQDGNFVDLQPLRTEGQGLDPDRYATTPYELTRAVAIVGGGVRARFGGRFVIGLEFSGRFTGTDYIDDIGPTQVNYGDILQSPRGSEAAFFSNPAVANPAEALDFEYVRGGDKNDYYFIGGLTFGITLGKAGNKSGCYSF